ncbi:creatininase family protein [Natronococcus sp. A-GB7]|uniref:creatininase family protein n=1 Tax=Natronococcus sp. A-GB7 TaxID=3037649 RepID=UPI00241FCE23|nr:creatininase family protein [Natronococcus sp. A-GB7]MDG5820850.1 creatininase family protein [Natronococcus sp. A-GB7]
MTDDSTRTTDSARTTEDPYRVAEMTWREIEDALESTSTLLLPVGTTEQHGHHLPLGVDVYMPEAIGERVAERSPALLAPPIWYGVSPHHTFKPGTFTLSSETFQRYVTDVCASAGRWGIESVVLLNGHYLAQDPELEIVVRELRSEHGIEAFHAPLVELFAEVAEEIRTGEVSFHASEFETSIMLELFPELVRMDRAERVDPPRESLPLTDYDALGDNKVGWSLTAEDMDELTPTGNIGDPTVATAETGAALVDAAVSELCRLVDALEDD